MRVEIEEEKEIYQEYHMYPVKSTENKFELYNEKKNKFNILLVMLDSFSHASAQRYLNKTYKHLKENPYSIIMQVCNVYCC